MAGKNRLCKVQIDKKRVVFTAILFIVAIFPIVIINKGIDVKDSGYYITMAKYAYTNPAVNHVSVVLSNWLNGLVFLFPKGQLFAMAVLCFLSYAAISMLTYFQLKEYFPRWSILLAIFLGQVCTFLYPYVSSYNTWSFLFLSIAIFLLGKGLEKDSLKLLCLAGFVIGLNVGNRIPNLVQFSLAGVVLWYYGFCLFKWKKAAARFFLFLAAAILGSTLIYCICLITHGYNQVFSNLFGLRTLSQNASSGYSAFINLKKIFDRIKDGMGIVLRYVVPPAAIGLVFRYWRSKKERSKILKNLIFFFSFVVAAAWGYMGFRRFTALSAKHIRFYSLLAALGLLLAILGMLIYRKHNPILSAISSMALVVVFAVPIGTNNLLHQYSVYSHFLLAFIAGMFCVLGNDFDAFLAKRTLNNNVSISHKSSILSTSFMPVLLAAICIGYFTLYPGYSHPYRDGKYSMLTSSVPGVPLLAGMQTSAERATVLEDVYKALLPYQDMKLAAMGEVALFPAMADMEPFFATSWPDLPSYALEDFAASLKRAEQDNKYPLVLLPEFSEKQRNARQFLPQKLDMLEQFMLKNDYSEAGATDAYTIYISSYSNR